MLTLYYGSGSPYAWRVQLGLEHKALPYERIVLSFAQGDLKKPEYLARNPRGKIPVLVDGDFVALRVGAILEYLDDAYPAQRPAAVSRRCEVARGPAARDPRGQRLSREGRRSAVDAGAQSMKPEERDLPVVAKARDAVASGACCTSHAGSPATFSAATRRVRPTSRCFTIAGVPPALRAEAAGDRVRRSARRPVRSVDGAHRQPCRSPKPASRRTGKPLPPR